MRQGTPGGYLMRKQKEGQIIPFRAAYLGQDYSRVLDRGYALNFVERRKAEVRLRRMLLPRTSVNRLTLVHLDAV